MQENRFKESLLNPKVFPVTWELVPGRGAREAAQEKTLTLAKQAASGGKVSRSNPYRQSGWNAGHVRRFHGQRNSETGH